MKDRIMNKRLIFVGGFLLLTAAAYSQVDEDPYIWLEDVNGARPMEWVNQKNKSTLDYLQKYQEYPNLVAKTLEILDSDERIAYPSVAGTYAYNFWQDKKNPRGLWRRMPLKEYLKGSHSWEAVLDIDELTKAEGVSWVFAGASWLQPDMKRCIVRLSPGGGDAVEMREFDAESKQFVKGGFSLPKAKGSTSWKDINTLYVSTDFGEGTTTPSGYPRMIKLWKRGTPLEQATLVYEGEKNDMGVWGGVDFQRDRQYEIISRRMDFYHGETFVIERGKLVKLEIPDDADMSLVKGQIILHLKSDWAVGGKTYKTGSLVGLGYQAFLNGDRSFAVIAEPGERSSIAGVSATENLLLVNMLNNVRSELYEFSLKDGAWRGERVNTPKFGTISVVETDNFSDRYFFTYQDFLTPTSLSTTDGTSGKIQLVKMLPALFDGTKYEVEQYETASKDGTMIPYFVVHRRGMKLDGSNLTLLDGYGGFEIARRPAYSAITGRLWLEYGGVYVVSNIRGGGEFGPRWHKAAIKENRQRAYDDFIAIAEDLARRKITSPKHLGISGGSNGGLLVGVAFTQRPDLFGAVVCSVPLLDMKRYNKLLAGASWMGEYGNPDIPEEWAYISKYSPYQNVKKGVQYPRVFFNTSTADDRVHPGHARKMVAKMEEIEQKVFYYENTEGGHAGASTNQQRAERTSLTYSYLLQELK
jgi:prolyl oligopeptidase